MATEQPSRGPLSDLVQAALDEGLSLRLLASRTRDDAGRETISKDTFQKIARGTLPKAPTGPDLDAIARALRKPPQVIKEAAARQWLDYQALHLSGYDDDMRRILVTLEGMDPQQRREWRAMLEASAEEWSRD